MIYKVESDKTVFDSNPGLDSNEVFSECTDRELKYVFLLYDIESPYIKMRFKDRQEIAAMKAGYRREKDNNRFDRNARPVLNGKSRRVNKAVEEFKRIQKSANTNYSVLQALKNQIDRNLAFLDNADVEEVSVDEMIKLNKLAGGLQDLIQTKVNIENILQVGGDDETDDEDVSDNLSELDKFNFEDEQD